MSRLADADFRLSMWKTYSFMKKGNMAGPQNFKRRNQTCEVQDSRDWETVSIKYLWQKSSHSWVSCSSYTDFYWIWLHGQRISVFYWKRCAVYLVRCTKWRIWIYEEISSLWYYNGSFWTLPAYHRNLWCFTIWPSCYTWTDSRKRRQNVSFIC